MKLADVFPSNYLAASDFDEDTVRTIQRVEEEILGQGKDAQKKAVIYFDEDDKGMVCNKTNFKTIASLHGDDTDDWIGKQITLYATEVPFGDKMVMSVRVRLKAPRPASQAKPGNGNAAPTGEPENPVAAGRARAWKAFIAATPSSDDANRKLLWLAALQYSFPLKSQKDFTADDWKTFTLEVQTGYDEANGGFIPV